MHNVHKESKCTQCVQRVCILTVHNTYIYVHTLLLRVPFVEYLGLAAVLLAFLSALSRHSTVLKAQYQVHHA